jgi:hypothetical protein
VNVDTITKGLEMDDAGVSTKVKGKMGDKGAVR